MIVFGDDHEGDTDVQRELLLAIFLNRLQKPKVAHESILCQKNLNTVNRNQSFSLKRLINNVSHSHYKWSW